MAHMAEQGARCDMCGTASWEWEEDTHAYEARDDFCLGCYRKHMKSEENESLPGTRVILVPRGTPAKKLLRPGQRRRKRRDRANSMS